MRRTILPLLLSTLAAGPLLAQQSFLAQKALERAAAFEQSYAKLQQLNGELERLTDKFQALRKQGKQEELQKLSGVYRETVGRFRMMHGVVQEKLKSTVDQLDAALQAEPKSVKLLAARARLAGFQGKGELAIELLDRALALEPKDHVLGLERGRYHFDLMHWDKAVADLDACIAAGHRAELCRQYKAQVLFYSEKFAEARQLFELLQQSKSPPIRNVAARFAPLARAYQAHAALEAELRRKEAEKDDLPRVKLVTSQGEILVELFEDQAPNTVANFIELAGKRFYDGTTFHRWVPNFLIQGGDPKSKDPAADPATLGQGDPGYAIADETGKQARRFFSGYLAMARRGDRPDSAGSQFFIIHVPAGWLNGRHTVFGRVIAGMDLVRKLRKGDKLVQIVVLRKRGHEYVAKKLHRATSKPVEVSRGKSWKFETHILQKESTGRVVRIIAIAEKGTPQDVLRQKCKATVDKWRSKGKDLIAVWVHQQYPTDDFGRIQWFAMASYDYKEGFKFIDKR